ncbi:MAG TPA: type 4a pilus biogenesis protein PilO [Patescibacteria group bacterium]|nr:type 4a pilus biogenesis protein PilO [Patescibacteria group bacterium]
MKFNYKKGLNKLYEKYLTPLNESEKKKFIGYFYLILTLLAVSFFGFFAIGPTLSTITNLNKQYDDNMVVYNALNQKLSNLRSLDSQYQQLQGSLDQIYSAIPKGPEIPKLTRQLENLAKDDGVQITNLVFGTVEIFPNTNTVTPIYSFTFTLDISGNDSQVNSFVADAINFDRIVGVEKIATGHNQEGKNTIDFVGRVFFAKK